ncbi:putative calcium-binding protein CML48 [Capsicum baccatum]|uniref:Calcium-binding protein CML48 n=1 Tax=Capsicum baccatum TaxID=33114 RepID=A0A2G2VPV5_CAPBA|nr:putative calcium-binding protein CML48 [Capsicum baccatum]
MSSYNNRASYSPSAPPLTDPNTPPIAHPYHPPPPSSTNYSYPNYPQQPGSYGYYQNTPNYASFFPPGTDPQVIQSFQMVDRDHSGFVEDKELQQALSSGYQRFSLRTIRLLIFLFKNPSEYCPRIEYSKLCLFCPPGTDLQVIQSFQIVDRDHSEFVEDKELHQALSSGYQRFSLRTIRLLIFLLKNPSEYFPRIGPKEFAALWSCLGQWRAIFERFDKDRSGKIDATELRDALYSLGYMVPPSVLEVLISRYTDGSGRRPELSFDSFVECGMVVKGLTEKFKEKDTRYTGSAKLTYDEFMSMILPFIVSY